MPLRPAQKPKKHPKITPYTGMVHKPRKPVPLNRKKYDVQRGPGHSQNKYRPRSA